MNAMARQHLTKAGRLLRMAELTILPEYRAALLAASQHYIQAAYTAWAQVAA